MSDAASFDAILQCNLLEVFCEAIGAAIFVTDKLDAVTFASVKMLQIFPIAETAIVPGSRARDLYGALYDAGCRFGAEESAKRDDWIAGRVASSWKERVDTIEPSGAERWFRIVSRRFASGLGLSIIQDVSETKKKEAAWQAERERVRMTEEILDRLPVAVAIKDSSLHFAAVNQQFCSALRLSSESLLGNGIGILFEPEFADALEQKEKELLVSGEEFESVVRVQNELRASRRFLYRARRIGRSGQRFLAMTFAELPDRLIETTPANADLSLLVRENAGGRSRIILDGSEAETHDTGLPHRIVLVHPEQSDPTDIRERAGNHGIDLCVVRGERELRAFLPALAQAGVAVDHVAIGAGESHYAAPLCGHYGLDHHCLADEADPLEAIVARLTRTTETTVPPAGPLAVADTGRSVETPPPARVDVLAVEDNAINRLALEQMFGSLGLSFEMALTGKDLLERLDRFVPKLVLADVTLPDMLAHEIVGSIQTRLGPVASRIPVIGVAPGGSDAERGALQTMGFADVLFKPLSPDLIDAAIRRHILLAGPMAADIAKPAA